jgi:hypothetical protein
MWKRAGKWVLYVSGAAVLIAVGAILGPMVQSKGAAAAAPPDRKPKKALRTPFSHNRNFAVAVVIDTANPSPSPGEAKYYPDNDPTHPISWGKPLKTPKVYKTNGNKRKLYLVYKAVGQRDRADGTGMLTVDIDSTQVDDICVEQVDPATFDINPCP